MKRVVLDTNIIISAFFWKGNPRKIYNLVKDGKIIMLYSKKIEAEFTRVLSYPKFGLTLLEIFPLIDNIRKYAHLIDVKSDINIIIADPTDNIFIECAVDGKADYIVSGDNHLLYIGNHKKVEIVRPKDFLIKEKFICR